MDKINIQNLIEEAKEKKLRANKIAGIYAIYCVENEKIYIGHSQRLDTRFSQHRADLKSGKHVNVYLQNVYNKHGLESLEFIVIEHCKEAADRFLREKFYIESIAPKSLINLSPPLNLEYGKLPPTFINEEWRAKISKSLTGRKLSDTHKENMKKAHLARSQDSSIIKNHKSKHLLIVLTSGEIIQMRETAARIKNSSYSYVEASYTEGECLFLRASTHNLFSNYLVTNEKIFKIIAPNTPYRLVDKGIIIDGVEFLF